MADANSEPGRPSATDTTDEKGTGKFSPFAGCSIFIIAGVLAAGMIGFTIWTYFKVKDTVSGFTEEKPQAIELAQTDGNESAQTDLKAKLVGFRHHIEAKNKAQLALNTEEMNLAIATFDILKPHRKNLTITSIHDDQIDANIAFPVKSSMGSDEMRYLNASITIKPELVEGAAFPRITSVKPNTGSELPEQFKQFISETLLHPFREDKELGPVFNGLSALEIKDNTLVLHTSPDYHPPSLPTEEKKNTMFERFMTGFAIIAVIFLAIVAFIIILSRRKAKQS